MANEQNLRPFDSNQDREQAKINGIKGGKASGEARRKKKAMKEQMELLLSLPLSNKKIKDKLEEMGVDTSDIDNQMALMLSTFNKALRGDSACINIIREITGERVQEIKINTGIDEKVQKLDDLLKKIE